MMALRCAVPCCFVLCYASLPARVLFVLTAVQYTLQSIYDPARAAAVPAVVAPHHLHLSATFDTYAYSLTALVGALAVSSACSTGWRCR